ncbi:pilus assembly protein PilM [Patescibacteria group bacterium]|nr:pilus assembly protein PilM [Patescibacteria group bacterium]
MFLFSKKSIGLDIGDRTINVVELISSGGKMQVSSIGHVEMPVGIVERGRIKNEARLAKYIDQAFATAIPQALIPKKVIFGLPKSQIYSHPFTVPIHSEDDRDDLVAQEVKASIPLEEDDCTFSYKVIGEDEDEVELLVIAASRQVVAEWHEFFEKMKLDVDVFDVEALAAFRGLFEAGVENPVCIVDIGAEETSIDIFNDEGLKSSFAVDVAGKDFTRAVARFLKIKFAAAEQQKRRIGLSKPGEQIFPVLVKALEPILKEVKQAIKYFQEKNNEKVEKIILVGGSARLRGIADYFSTNLKLPAELGESDLLAGDGTINKKEALEYIQSAGLALRGLDKDWEARDVAMSPEAMSPLVAPKKNFEMPEEKKVGVISNGVGPESNVMNLVEEKEETSKLNVQKIILLVILVVGFIGIAGAYWFKSNQQAKQEQDVASLLTAQFQKNQSIEVKVPVALKASAYTTDRVQGRTIEDSVESAANFEEAKTFSKAGVETETNPSEFLWSDPLNSAPAELVFPLTMTWLVFNPTQADGFILAEVNKLNKNKVQYILNSIEKTKIELTDNPDVVYLWGRVNISLDEMIEISQEETGSTIVPAEKPAEASEVAPEEIPAEPTEETPAVIPETAPEEFPAVEPELPIVEEKVPTVTIKETETGWLNARSGPGTTFEIISKVNPGESYPLLQESNQWFKIELADGQEGWISAAYGLKQ